LRDGLGRTRRARNHRLPRAPRSSRADLRAALAAGVRRRAVRCGDDSAVSVCRHDARGAAHARGRGVAAHARRPRIRSRRPLVRAVPSPAAAAPSAARPAAAPPASRAGIRKGGRLMPVCLRILFALVILLTAALDAAAQAADTLVYTLRFPQPEHHWMEVELVVRNAGDGPLRVRMSRASPGRYAIHEFAKNIFSIAAEDGTGRILRLSRVNADE